MAANEHKNLSSANRHLPKGFESASNETVLTKGIGTPGFNDGNLEWTSNVNIGVTYYKMQGFLTGILNYQFGEDIADTKSPYEIAKDYGFTTVPAGLFSVTNAFRMGQGHLITANTNVTSISGWITSSGANTVTIALCKITPAEGVTTNLVPTIVSEVTVTGLSNNNKMVRVLDTTITTPALLAGDIIFPMVKEGVAGSDIFMNIEILTSSF